MNIHTSPYPSPSIPTNLTLSQFLSNSNPDSVPNSQLIFEDDWSGKKLTYGSLRELASRHASTWSTATNDGGFGLSQGDVVGICGVNSVDYVSAIHGVLWAGGVVAMFSAQSTVKDFKHAFEIVKPKYLVVDVELVERLREALGDSGTKVVVFGDEISEYPLLPRYPLHFSSKTQLPIQALPPGKTAKEVTAAILFSSGTSGLPKAVELSHYAFMSQIVCFRASEHDIYNSSTERCVFFPPLCHIYGFSTALLCPWLGTYMMLMRQFELHKFLKLSEETKATSLLIVPTIATQMVKKGVLEKYDLGSVTAVVCAGAVLEDAVLKVLKGRLNGAPVAQGYGMTESTIATLKACEAGHVGSVGRLLPGVQARIVDNNMKDVQPGQIGELLVRGPMVFKRYLDNPLATKEAFHEGWLKTGDLLRIDNESFLYYFDRKKEIIKYKGFQISPTELEAILTTHPSVLEAAVCAKWDPKQGTEIPIAYIVLKNPLNTLFEKDVVSEGIRKWFDEKVAGYKKLRGGVKVIDVLPRTPLGKIMRRELPARVELRKLREGVMRSRL